MKPRVFIGSSTESLEIADAIHHLLDLDAEVTVWSQSSVQPSATILESLIQQISTFDFGVFVLSPDDRLTMRGREEPTARDNVLLELGMFLGRFGRERCFCVAPRDADLHLPTDLLGAHLLTFNAARSDGNLKSALGPAASEIRRIIKQMGLSRQTRQAPLLEVQYPRPITQDEVSTVEDILAQVLAQLPPQYGDEQIYLIFADVDNFSAINRWYGADVCDDVLRAIDLLVSSHFKDAAFRMRLGGDQFLICVFPFTRAQLAKAADELVKSVENHDWSSLASNLRITCSIGVSKKRSGEPIQGWIVRAIHGSIKAKKEGGNCVRVGPIALSKTDSKSVSDYLS